VLLQPETAREYSSFWATALQCHERGNVGSGSKGDELSLSKSGPLCPNERTPASSAVTWPSGHVRKQACASLISDVAMLGE
jgi:hypothetical protein